MGLGDTSTAVMVLIMSAIPFSWEYQSFMPFAVQTLIIGSIMAGLLAGYRNCRNKTYLIAMIPGYFAATLASNILIMKMGWYF